MRDMKTVVALMAVLFALSASAGATSIMVPNAGFEVRGTYDPIPDGEHRYPRPAIESWRYFEAGGNGGPARIVNPPTGFVGSAAEGDYCVRVVTDPRPWVLTIQPIAGVAQILSEPFDPDTTYTLTAQVARYTNNTSEPDDNWNGYAVQLAAGGTNHTPGGQYSGQVIGGTVIAEDWNTQSVPFGQWVTSTVQYTPDPGDAALAGQPLQIRLVALRDPNDPAFTWQDPDPINSDYVKYAAFDAVTLDGVSTGVIPEPMTMLAVGMSVAGLGGYIRRRSRG